MRQVISFAGLTFASAAAWSAEGLGTVPEATPLWVWICVGAAAMVFVAIGYSVAAYKQPSTAAPGTNRQQCKPARELLWASVPIAIVVAAATPSLTSTTAEDLATVTQTARAVELCAESAKTLRPGSIPSGIPELRKMAESSCTAQR